MVVQSQLLLHLLIALFHRPSALPESDRLDPAGAARQVREGILDLAVSLLLGCGQQSQEPPPKTAALVAPVADAVDPRGAKPPKAWPELAQPGNIPGGLPQDMLAAPDAAQQKYDEALLQAIDLVAQKKYADGLASLETAATFKNTELVQAEIAKLRGRIDQQRRFL